MHRFFVPNPPAAGDLIDLPETEAHHAVRVLRVQPGELVAVLDGAGGEFSATVEAIGKREATLRVTNRHRHPEPTFQLTLVQAIAKGPAMDGLLHRAVELGCARVIPLLAEHSVSRPDDAAAKQAKWQAAAVEAAKQSGNPWLMRIDAPITPTAWLARHEKFDLLLVASLADDPQHARECFARFRRAHGYPPKSVAVIIGPEGDFSPAEYAAFRTAGAQPITLGPFVLRVETAAIYALSVVASELSAGALGH